MAQQILITTIKVAEAQGKSIADLQTITEMFNGTEFGKTYGPIIVDFDENNPEGDPFYCRRSYDLSYMDQSRPVR